MYQTFGNVYTIASFCKHALRVFHGIAWLILLAHAQTNFPPVHVYWLFRTASPANVHQWHIEALHWTKKLFSTTQNKHCLIAMQTYKECFTFLYANHWQGLSVQETKHHFRRVRRFFAIRGSLVGWCMNISQPRRKVFAECVNLCIHWHWNFFYCSEITIWIVWRRCLMWQSKQDFLALST